MSNDAIDPVAARIAELERKRGLYDLSIDEHAELGCLRARDVIATLSRDADVQTLIRRAHGMLIRQGGEIPLTAAVCLEDAVRILIGKDNPDGTPNPRWNEEWNQ